MPLKSNLRIDKLLSNVSVKYRNEEYIAPQVFPIVQVGDDTGKYRVYDRQFRLPNTTRASGAKANEHTWDSSFNSYALEWHSLKEYISDDQKSQWEGSDLKADATEQLTDVILRRVEKSTLDLFTTTSWSLNVSLAAASAWNSNTTTSNPIPVVDTGASTVLQNSGKMPNVGVISHDGFIAVKNHVSIADRVKYTSSEISKSMVAGLFDLGELLVARQVIDTSAPGVASSISYLMGDSMWLGYREMSPGPMKASAGYIFKQAKPPVKSWRDEERESDAVEVNYKYQPKIVASLAGYLIKDII